MKLIIEVEVQTYGENELDVLKAIRDAIVPVIALADLSVGTFVKSDVK